MKKIFFLFLVSVLSFAACKNEAAGSKGTEIEMPELVGFVSESWFEAHKNKASKINYNATINGTPVLEDDFKWYRYGKYLYLSNADHTNTTGFAPDFRGWYITLYPANPEKNDATTFLIKDAGDKSKWHKFLKVKNVKIVNGQYFDPDTGKPFDLELTIEGWPDTVVIKGTKK